MCEELKSAHAGRTGSQSLFEKVQPVAVQLDDGFLGKSTAKATATIGTTP